MRALEHKISEASNVGAHQPSFRVPFFRTDTGDSALAAIEVVLRSEHLAGNGRETAAVHAMLRNMIPGAYPLITHSGTAALEMAALLLDLVAGDEVIMPSWTFPSTANAVALRGAIPVFVDVAQNTLNIDPEQVEAAVTPRSRAVFCVHYAGVACDMTALAGICDRHGLALVEDAAQAIGASWNGSPLGGLGDFGAISFHASKNVVCGEGGALLVNRQSYVDRAEMIWEKGTDRAQFSRGEVSHYEWKTIGSSYLPSEITAALLRSQLKRERQTTRKRVTAWQTYDRKIRSAGLGQILTLPEIPVGALHNGHSYIIRTKTGALRNAMRRGFAEAGVEALTHYVPLHSSPAGLQYGKVFGELPNTDAAATTLLRLPLYAHITPNEQDLVVETIRLTLG